MAAVSASIDGGMWCGGWIGCGLQRAYCRCFIRCIGAGWQFFDEFIRAAGDVFSGRNDGVALLVDALTDNVNRTVAEVRSSFNKRDGKMGAPGSVGYLFDEKGQIRISKADVSYETIFEAAVEAGAEEVEDAEDDWLLTTAREDLYLVNSALEEAGLTASEVQLAKLPQTTVDITDLGTAKKIMALIDHLEDNDDVQTVWANFDLSDEVAASLAAECPCASSASTQAPSSQALA